MKVDHKIIEHNPLNAQLEYDALSNLKIKDKFQMLQIVNSVDIEREIENMPDFLFLYDQSETKFMN